MKQLLIALALTTSFLSAPALAGRDTKKIGVFAGVITSPLPSIYGFGAAYNLTGFLRVSGNIGFISSTGSTYTIKATTLAGDAKLFIPSFNRFSPFASLGYANVDVTVTGTGADLSSLGGLGASAGSLTYGFGLDWQTDMGFNLGVEYEILAKTGDGLPGIYLGWYF